jgi:hypothetical protein
MPLDPWKQKLTPVNPLPANRKTSEKLNETGRDMAEDGYTVLDRANPGDPFNPNRRGLTGPVYDRPNVAWDE